MPVGSNPGKTFSIFLVKYFFSQKDALNYLEFQVSYSFMYHAYVKKLYSIKEVSTDM